MTVLEKKPPTSSFVIAFAAIYLIWGSTYLAIRVAVQTMPPFAMASARFFIAGVVLFAFVRARGAAWPTRRQWLDNAIIGTALLLGGNGLTAMAETTIPSAVTALIISITPIFMVLTEWAWRGGQRPHPAVFIGMILGFVGVAYLGRPEAVASATHLDRTGLIAILFACVFWSFGSIYARNTKPAAPPFVASALQMLCGSVMLGLTAGLRGEWTHLNLSSISRPSWIGFVYLILIGSLVGFSTFVWLMKHSTPARTATYAYVNPIVAIFLGWFILHEPISPHIEIAATCIIGAVIIVTTQKSRPRTSSTNAFAVETKKQA